MRAEDRNHEQRSNGGRGEVASALQALALDTTHNHGDAEWQRRENVPGLGSH